jgi:hypothetical protein
VAPRRPRSPPTPGSARSTACSRVFTSTTDDTCLNVYGGLPAGPTRYRLSISTDRGKDKRYVTLTHPKKPGTVSFRASLTDTDGNTAARPP